MEKTTVSRAEYEELQRKYKLLEQKYADLQKRIDYLMALNQLARYKRFGKSSEQTPGQLCLFDEAEVYADEQVPEPEISKAETDTEHEADTVPETKGKGAGADNRKKAKSCMLRLPKDTPVEVVEHTIPENERICPQCGDVLRQVGKTVHDTLKIIPAKIVIVRDISYTYACANCEKTALSTPIMKAAIPPSLIKGSIASPEAAAHIMTQKFVMGLPLHRQSQEWERLGVPLSRQTMSNWLIRCTEDYLVPVWQQLKSQLLQSSILHADETTLQVLHEEGKSPQSKSYMWMYRTGKCVEHPIVVYDYQPDRKKERPANFLKGYKGYLHTDAYQAYHSLPDDIVVVGCWAHARRKFSEALISMPSKSRADSLSDKAMRYCDRLFHLESEFADLTPEERCKRRQSESRPLIDEFYKLLYSLKISEKSLFGEAAGYMLKQKKYLYNYLLDGDLEISNNLAERSIKPFVIDRKNFIFANTSRGADASAVMFSLIQTAKESGLNPCAYLTWLLKNASAASLPDHPETAAQFTPAIFAETQQNQ